MKDIVFKIISTLVSALLIYKPCFASTAVAVDASVFQKVSMKLSGDQRLLRILEVIKKSRAKVYSESQKKLEQTIEKTVQAPQKTLSHVTSTLMLIMIVMGAEMVRQEFHQSKISNEQINSIDLAKAGLSAANALLSSGDIWASLLGAGVTAYVFKKPIELLTKLIAESTTKKWLAKVLQGGIVTYITFVGWDFGSQLWQEARLLLEDEADYKYSETFVGSSVAFALKGFFQSSSERHQQHRAVMSKLTDNLLRILYYDEELRASLIYNLWRLKLATGHFATLVSSIVAMTTAGSMIFPAAGSIAGFMFGLLGVGVATIIPAPVKESITDKFKSVRIKLNKEKLNTNQLELTGVIRSMRANEWEHSNKVNAVGLLFSKRQSHRNDLLTAYFERIYLSAVRRNEIYNENSIINDTLVFKSISSEERHELQRLVEENTIESDALKVHIQLAVASLSGLYSDEYKTLNRIKEVGERVRLRMRRYGEKYGTEVTNMTNTVDVRVNEEMSKIETMKSYMKQLQENIYLNTGIQFSNVAKVVIESSHFSGFKEAKILDEINDAASKDSQ